MNKLLTMGAVLALAVGGWLVFLRNPGPEPLLDANRAQLAETANQGRCAGQTFWRTQGYGDANEFANCVDQKGGAGERDLSQVVPQFCWGLIDAGWPGLLNDCMDILYARRWWPTLTGELTDQWNRSFPYPGDVITTGKADSESRTGDRTGNLRSSEGDR